MVKGRLGPTGYVPHFMDLLQAMGQKVDPQIFDPARAVIQDRGSDS
jgi:hypothetical protein